MAKTNKRKNKRFGKKGKGKTSRFFKNLFGRQTAPVTFEEKKILNEKANMAIKKKPYPKKEKFTRGKVIANMFDSDTYSGPKYGPNNSNSSISTSSLSNDSNDSNELNKENGSPTNEDEIMIEIGGKRKTKKRKYKKII